MRPGGCAFVLAMTVVAVADAAATRQRFRSGTDAVAVDVLVTRGGRPVAGLRADNFDLYDSGIAQRIDGLFFQTLPLNVVVALDTSGSTAGRPLADLKDAAHTLVRNLRTGDRMALVTFSDVVDLASGWTGDPATLRAAIDRTAAGGSTALLDAVFSALTLTEGVAGRSLVLVFSDGLDNSSWLNAADVIGAATQANAVVYTVQSTPLPRVFTRPELRAQLLKAPRINSATFLPVLGNETGGDALWVRESRVIEKVFVRILDEFRIRYVLTYSPAGVPADGWHPIEVKLRNTRGTVTARRGYLRK